MPKNKNRNIVIVVSLVFIFLIIVSAITLFNFPMKKILEIVLVILVIVTVILGLIIGFSKLSMEDRKKRYLRLIEVKDDEYKLCHGEDVYYLKMNMLN